MPFIRLEYQFKRFSHSLGKLFLVTSVVGSLVWFLVAPISCHLPKAYSLGVIDERFSLTDDEVTRYLERAEAVWEVALGTNIFEFNDTKGLPVNFVYDERQQRTDDGKKIDILLSEISEQRQDVEVQINKLTEQYETLLALYDSQSAAYENRVADFNATVDYWNSELNVPKRVVSSIKQEQKELDQMRAELENQRIQINKIVDQLNIVSGSDRRLVKEYNTIAGSFQDVYGGVELFDRAVFTGDEINVYEFSDEDALVLALAHELGHYAGLDHVENSRSLMYYLMQDQDVADPTLTVEDVEEFNGVCGVGDKQWFGGWKALLSYTQNIL